MQVGVGYSESSDTLYAGREAAVKALRNAKRTDPCDLAMLFSTSVHDPHVLRGAVSGVIGSSVPIVGGGAVGAISNDEFGYAGDQVIMAAMWLEGAGCEIISESGLERGEEATGRRLGAKFLESGVEQSSDVLLFYDAIDRSGGDMRLLMATPMLSGIKEGLGFMPDICGAGLQSDYIGSPYPQWTGGDTSIGNALALAFSGDVRIDSTIMHGCKPATGYYTVTKADSQTILEIDDQPALGFLDSLFEGAVRPDDLPFFLILGVNEGAKWDEFDEKSYANRLCLAIDKERGGIVMFEPDMVEGTKFQVMYRNLDLDYMVPRIERTFNRLHGRKPVFAVYIDCAGRAAGFGGVDMEDAVVVQKAIGNRVPLLGIYTGVEIASVGGRPRGLDWTGVLCVFSVPR